MYDTLITCEHLHANYTRPDWVILDCRYDLSDTGTGLHAYKQGHIPGAVYIDLDMDLCGPLQPACGRHPLPSPERMVSLFSELGIGPGTQAVIYDASFGAIAARMWWMLHYMGHEAAAVVDGGWQAWVKHGFEIEQKENNNSKKEFQGEVQGRLLVTLGDFPLTTLLVDSREPPRYRGEIEPIDPVAGHIPGAVNYYWKLSISEDGTFYPVTRIREAMLGLFTGISPDQGVFYCGSGVTACHNLLAARYAGLPLPRLYAGSWSEWCSDVHRPVARG